MRNLIVVLLMGALYFLGFGDTVARPVIVERPARIEHLVLQHVKCEVALHIGADLLDSAAVLVASVATPLSMPVEYSVHRPLQVALARSLISEGSMPAPVSYKPQPLRFYHRWRKVHGRWYRFTYRAGSRRAEVLPKDVSWC